MLSLDDPRWGQLQHAYGFAHDITNLRKSLRLSAGPQKDYRGEPWFSLWSSLCHQGDVYSASYAAVPHIVRIGTETRAPLDFSFFQFPAAVEIARVTGHGPAVPEDMVDAYHDAISSLGDCVSLHRNDAWDRDTLLSALAAQAVSKGFVAIADALLDLDDDWIAKINSHVVD